MELGRDGEALLLLVLPVAAGRDGEEAVVGVAQALHVEARRPTHGLIQALHQVELLVHGVEELRLDGAARAERLMAGMYNLVSVSMYLVYS